MHKQAALVIGALRGIGLAVVRYFSAQGEGVVATWNTTQPAGGETNVTWLQADISRRDSLMSLKSACAGRSFDFILVNAGICGPAHMPLYAASKAELNVLPPLTAGNGEGTGRNAALPSSRMGENRHGWQPGACRTR